MVDSAAPGGESAANLALDFVNTAPSPTWGPDRIATPEGLIGWYHEALQGHDSGFPSLPASLPERRSLVREAALLRGALRTLFGATVHGTTPAAPTLFALDRVLSAARTRREITLVDQRLRLRTRHEADTSLGVLAPFVVSAIRLVETASPARLRTCASEPCGRWFLDTSKGGRRRWCSMAVCGNRAKAARFRERHAVRA